MKESLIKPNEGGGENLIVPKKWKGAELFAKLFQGKLEKFMLEAFGCVQNQVLSTFGKKTIMHKKWYMQGELFGLKKK